MYASIQQSLSPSDLFCQEVRGDWTEVVLDPADLAHRPHRVQVLRVEVLVDLVNVELPNVSPDLVIYSYKYLF